MLQVGRPQPTSIQLMIYLIVLICTLDVPSTCAAVKRWRQHLEHEVLCRKLLETERRHQQIGLLRAVQDGTLLHMSGLCQLSVATFVSHPQTTANFCTKISLGHKQCHLARPQMRSYHHIDGDAAEIAWRQRQLQREN